MEERMALRALSDRVDFFKEEYSLNVGQAFLMWYAVDGMDLAQDVAFEAVSLDGPNDKGIDFFYVDDELARVVIAQGKFNKNGKAVGKVGQLLELIHTTDWLNDSEDLTREGRGDLAEAGDKYQEAIKKSYSTEYVYIYSGGRNKDVEGQVAQFNKKGQNEDPPRIVRAIDLPRICRIHAESLDSSTRIGREEIKVGPEVFEHVGPYGKALVANVPGREIQRLYQVHDVSLFDRNIRLFLGGRTSVNKRIRETLGSTTERRNFWAYNNGMTFICDGVDYNSSSSVVNVKNFSIVNGCQTAVSIGNASKAAADDVMVLARFIASSEESTVNSIITYTNSQNPIRPWDLSSQDKSQKRLKRELAGVATPYFYELRRGEKSNLSKEEREKFKNGGKMRVIKHDLLSQYVAAFNGMPVPAYKDKALLSTKYKSEVFPPDIRVEKVLFVWQTGEIADQVVKMRLKRALQEDEETMVHILKRGGKLFVLAVAALLLCWRNGASYLAKLKAEIAVSRRTEEKLKKYMEAAILFYSRAVQDEMQHGVEDLNKIVRAMDNWKSIQDRVKNSWELQCMVEGWMEGSLPAIGER